MQTFIAAVSSALIISFMCSVFESVVLSINTAQVEALAVIAAIHGNDDLAIKLVDLETALRRAGRNAGRKAFRDDRIRNEVAVFLPMLEA